MALVTSYEEMLVAHHDAGSAAWPGVTVAPAVFAAWLSERAPTLAELEGIDAAGLYLTCACASGDPTAARVFRDRFLPELARVFSRARNGNQDRLVGPIRGELLGAERLAEHARAVARRQRVRTPGRTRRVPLLERLEETYQILLEARDVLSDAADEGIDVSPAGEWLLDNFYTVEEHIREIRATLPRGYYRELPELSTGPLARFPRVYEIAIELIAHTEGHLDLANTELFVREFQSVTPLKIGELWAIPAMLRLGLIENIRRMTRRTVSRLDEVRAADAAAERLRAASEEGPKALAAALHADPEHRPAERRAVHGDRHTWR